MREDGVMAKARTGCSREAGCFNTLGAFQSLVRSVGNERRIMVIVVSPWQPSWCVEFDEVRQFRGRDKISPSKNRWCATLPGLQPRAWVG